MKLEDIRNYLPNKFPEENIPKVIALGLNVANAVHHQLPIGLWYDGIFRIVLLHALFLQYPTSEESTAQKAVGISAYQIYSNQPEDSENGWKTFLLHEINGLEIFIGEKVKAILNLDSDEVNGIQLNKPFDVRSDFDEFWRSYQRRFLEKTPSGNSARKHPGLVLLQK